MLHKPPPEPRDSLSKYKVGEESTYSTTPLSLEKRRQILDAQILHLMTAETRELVYRNDFDAVFSRGRPINHLLHFIVCIFTVGFWMVGWLLLIMNRGVWRENLHVTTHGEIILKKEVGKRNAENWALLGLLAVLSPWVLLIGWCTIAVNN